MEIINPNEIGAKISTLIAESNEKFYAITPYVKISEWKKIIVSIKQAEKRNVSIKFFVRELDQLNYQTLTNLGVEIFRIAGLHTKLYLNEREVIVSSMNLYETSDLHSIDIAILYKDTENYNKIYDYFLRYIKPDETINYHSKTAENNLLSIQKHLVDTFSNTKINLSGDYLFSKNLIPRFDVFIRQNEMILKSHNKQILEHEFDKITIGIENNKKYKVTPNKATGNYSHCTWNIELPNFTSLEFVELINLTRVSTRPTAIQTS